MTHCDDLIDDPSVPKCVRDFLLFHRAPATEQWKRIKAGELRPKLFAIYRGYRVRVTMASRFGDLGITTRLKAQNGYDKRVDPDELSGFSAHYIKRGKHAPGPYRNRSPR